MKRVLFLMLVLTVNQAIKSQDLEQHQWKNRLLLVFSKDKTSNDLTKQINILSKDKKGIEERKLIVYQFVKNSFTTNFNQNWFPIKKLPKKHHSKIKNFEVVLVGLDGGIKLRQTKIVSLEKLFALIDGMPMRKRELKN